MAQDIVVPMVSLIFDDKILFYENKVEINNLNPVEYSYKGTSLENKRLIREKINEINPIVSDIIDEVTGNKEFIKFLAAYIDRNLALLLGTFEGYFVEKYLDDMRITTGINWQSYKILNYSNEIVNTISLISEISFEYLTNKLLPDEKNKYLEYLAKIKSFSIEDIVNKLGYSSLEEMELYHQKYLYFLKNNREYLNFMGSNKGKEILRDLSNFDVYKFIENKINFIFETMERYEGISYATNDAECFFLLDKNKIDNFKEFIDSLKINVITNFEENKIKPSLFLSETGINSFIGNSNPLNFYPTNNRENIIMHYYNDDSTRAYSYANGLYYPCYNFLIKNILDPTCYQIIEKYKKTSESYGLNKIADLSYDFVNQELFNIISKYQSSSEYNNYKEFQTFSNIILKKYIFLNFYNNQTNGFTNHMASMLRDVKKEIYKETKDGIKEINIDEILKKVDSEYKNLTDPEIFNILFDSGTSSEIIIKQIINRLMTNFNISYAQNIKSTVDKSFLSRLKKDEAFSDSVITSPEENEELKLKINITNLLSEDELRKMMLNIRYQGYQPYSYKKSLFEIDQNIMTEKAKILGYIDSYLVVYNFYLKKINKNSIETFFNTLKNIAIKQVQQEESFLQGKSTSLGILDELKFENTNIKNFSISKEDISKDMRHISDAIYKEISKSDNGLFNIFYSFHKQIFSHFKEVLLFFCIFPEEAEPFFNSTDFNHIKNSIIKMFNFINSNENQEKINKIMYLSSGISFTIVDGKLQRAYIAFNEVQKKESSLPTFPNEHDFNDYKARGADLGFESYEDYLKEIDRIKNLKNQIEDNNHSCTEFLYNFFKDKDLGTKKEKVTRLLQISQLIHNYENNNNGSLFLDILLGSKYFEKSYNKSIYEIINTIGITVGSFAVSESTLSKTIEKIKEFNPKLIPKEYLSENISYCVSNIENIKTSNDLDKIIEKLLLGDYSDNIRKFNYLTSLASQYENTIEWMGVAKPKIEEVFAPNFSARLGPSTPTFRFRVLGDLDPYHFRVGIDAGCCQHIGGAGAGAAVDSFINPTAGVVVLETNEDNGWKLQAQSYFHYAEVKDENSKEVKKAIILDNIESGSLRKYGGDFYDKAYATLGLYLKNKGFDIVGCGSRGTYTISCFKTSSLKSDPRHFEVDNYKNVIKYIDFDPDRFYDLLQPNFSFEMPKDINSVDTEMSVKSARILDLCIQKTGNKKAMSLNKLSKTLLSFGFKKEAADIRRLLVGI